MLTRYEPWLKKTVFHFTRSINPHNLDDLLQEARIVFLWQLRMIEHESAIFLCKIKVKQALFDYAREMATVHIPLNKFTMLRHEFVQEPETTIVEEVTDSYENAILTRMVYQSFLAGLTQAEQIAVLMKSQGQSNARIMQAIGAANEMQVSRMLKRLRLRLATMLYYE